MPRLFLGRTDEGNLWRFGVHLPEATCEELASLGEDEPLTLIGRPKYESTYIQILSALSPVERTWFGPAYWFPRGAAPTAGPVLMNEENSHFLQCGLEAWLPDVPHHQPFAVMIENRRAVSVCASVRITPAAHEAGVETLEKYRRKGYAVLTVSTWAKAVEEMGALPLYSTSIENVASQSVAVRLDLARYGVDFHVV